MIYKVSCTKYNTETYNLNMIIKSLEVYILMVNSIVSSLYFLIEPFLLLLGNISNNNSFPKPLTQKEEETYLKLYEQGDRHAKNMLIERNLRLVAHIVKKYNNTGREIDDLISIGTIGLIKAIKTFDRNKNVRLSTYAARCIDNRSKTQRLHIEKITLYGVLV